MTTVQTETLLSITYSSVATAPVDDAELAALLGIGLGACAPVVAGWWLLRRPRDPGVSSEEHGFRRVMRETFHNSHVLLAFFALSNADIIVARNALDAHDAGLYAGGVILMGYTPRVRIHPPLILTVEEAVRALDVIDHALAVCETC